jgi:hypothetical protein
MTCYSFSRHEVEYISRNIKIYMDDVFKLLTKERMMTATLFFEDFDGNGAGFSGSPFETWSIGGVPIGPGHWERFYNKPEQPNLTSGSGNYAAVHLVSHEFLDTLVWMISPIIDVRKHTDLTLSTDLYFRAGGQVGEDIATIVLLRAGHPPETLSVIGDTLSAMDDPLKQHMTWDISPDSDFVQVAFPWVISAGGSGYDSIQVDNIRIIGIVDCFKT